MTGAILLSLFVLLPAAVFAFLPARARRSFIAAALAAFIAVHFLGDFGGHNPLVIFPLALLGIALGGILVEAVVLIRRVGAKKGAMASHG